MKIATWNLNNRVGMVRFRPEAAHAAISVNADVIVFNEYYPQEASGEFQDILKDHGWSHQCLSEDCGVKANRVLIASRFELRQNTTPPPVFDKQFSSNWLCVDVPEFGITVAGIRVPWYSNKTPELISQSWDWLENFAHQNLDQPTLMLGDFNARLNSPASRGGAHLRRILSLDWHRAGFGTGSSYFGSGESRSEIDHILANSKCTFSNSRYVTACENYVLAGDTNAISDHALLCSDVQICN
ncbi:MAG: hypothetical protein CFE43_17325 [Burkholderiales bacterium PBB3]|nr:MAG: hypothetical protein CFE43_17325 [Burkholderiales bacterium PBB3]